MRDSSILSLHPSSPQGRIRKALLIGIKYTHQLPKEKQLDRCHKDVDVMYRILLRDGYDRRNIRVLRDRDFCVDDYYPNRENIIKAMNWLVQDATPNHTLFFYFAGHGRQVEDIDGDEDDGLDEAIVPADRNGKMAPLGTSISARIGRGLRILRKLTRGSGCGPLEDTVILDDDMRAIMCVGLPKGCRLRAVFDMCHSGTPLDLDLVFTAANVRQSSLRLTGTRPHGIVPGIFFDIRQQFYWLYRILTAVHWPGSFRLFISAPTRVGPAEKLARPGICADVVSLGSCADAQQSYDDTSLAKILHRAYELHGHTSTWRKLLCHIDETLRANEQIPTLGSSQPLDWDTEFRILE